MTPTPTTTAGDVPPIPADWSQFLPDLASSAIIGLLIGVALYLWQRGSEARHDTRMALASWSVARSRVKVAMEPTAPAQPQANPKGADTFTKVEEATSGLPLPLWAAQAPKSHELSLLNEIATELPLLQQAGAKLVSAVNVALMKLNSGLIFSADKEYLRDTTLRAAASDDEFYVGLSVAIMRAFGGEGAAIRAQEQNEVAMKASEDAEVKRARSEYVRQYVQLAGMYNELRGLLYPAESTVQTQTAETDVGLAETEADASEPKTDDD